MADRVSDQRFQKVHNDPRFARNSKRKSKLKIDKRFAAVLHDDRFKSVQGKYDKYGRRIDKKSEQLNKFYDLEEEDEEENEDNDEEKAENKVKVKSAKGKAKQQKKKDLKEDSGESDDDDGDDASSTTSSNGDEDKSAAATVDKNDEKLSRLEYLNRMARGELESGSSSSSSDSEDSDDDSEVDVDAEEEKEEDIPMGGITKRFAVLNCDWTRIRAIDLFALCQSFAPATGAVENVTIYPSDFGLQKMKEEEQFGPQGLWEDEDKKKDSASDDENNEEMADGDGEAKTEEDEDNSGSDASGSDKDDEEQEEKEEKESEEENNDADGYDSDDPLGVKKSVKLEDEMDGFDREKLRKYELQKLKYYYAVVTCDSAKTASAIFDNCDQLEYETSSNVLDLRFVPDDVEFTNAPKESCDSVPDNYKPAVFATMALQQTDVKLTWEEDDQSRMELLTRHNDWKDADDDDFAAYLASDVSSAGEEDDDSDADEEEESERPADKKKDKKLKKLKNRYRKALLGSDAEDDDDEAVGDEKSPFAGSSDEEPASSDDDAGEGDMEMSFTPGASDILRAKKQRELEANETPFERYQREKKQQKNQKQHEKRAKQKALAREQKELLQKSKKAVPNEVKLLREAIDGDSDDSEMGEMGDRNFDMKKIAKQEKVQKLKGKRKTKEMKKLQSKKSGLQEGFEFDAADPRFSALYAKGSQFQLDPTDPKYKKTEATQAIFAERRKRNESGESRAAVASSKPEATIDAKGSSKNELKSIVENLKRKSLQDAEKKKSKAKKQKF